MNVESCYITLLHNLESIVLFGRKDGMVHFTLCLISCHFFCQTAMYGTLFADGLFCYSNNKLCLVHNRTVVLCKWIYHRNYTYCLNLGSLSITELWSSASEFTTEITLTAWILGVCPISFSGTAVTASSLFAAWWMSCPGLVTCSAWLLVLELHMVLMCGRGRNLRLLQCHRW